MPKIRPRPNFYIKIGSLYDFQDIKILLFDYLYKIFMKTGSIIFSFPKLVKIPKKKKINKN